MLLKYIMSGLPGAYVSNKYSNRGMEGNFYYNLYPNNYDNLMNNFGYHNDSLTKQGDYDFNLYPSNNKSSNFGKKVIKRKSNKKKIGYIVRKGKVVNVYSKKTKTGKIIKCTSNGRKTSSKIFKTKVSAKNSINKA